MRWKYFEEAIDDEIIQRSVKFTINKIIEYNDSSLLPLEAISIHLWFYGYVA